MEIKIDEVPPLNKPQVGELEKPAQSWHDKMSEAEEEKEAVDGLFDPQPPVGILKKSRYVSGEEEVAAASLGNEKLEKKRSNKSRRKLVPVWRLVSYLSFDNSNQSHNITCTYVVSICQLLGYLNDHPWNSNGHHGWPGLAWTHASLWSSHQ